MTAKKISQHHYIFGLYIYLYCRTAGERWAVAPRQHHFPGAANSRRAISSSPNQYGCSLVRDELPALAQDAAILRWLHFAHPCPMGQTGRLVGVAPLRRIR